MTLALVGLFLVTGPAWQWYVWVKLGRSLVGFDGRTGTFAYWCGALLCDVIYATILFTG